AAAILLVQPLMHDQGADTPSIALSTLPLQLVLAMAALLAPSAIRAFGHRRVLALAGVGGACSLLLAGAAPIFVVFAFSAVALAEGLCRPTFEDALQLYAPDALRASVLCAADIAGCLGAIAVEAAVGLFADGAQAVLGAERVLLGTGVVVLAIT